MNVFIRFEKIDAVSQAGTAEITTTNLKITLAAVIPVPKSYFIQCPVSCFSGPPRFRPKSTGRKNLRGSLF